MNGVDFYRDLAALEVKLQESILGVRSRELQKQVLLISTIVLMTSLGIYSLGEIHFSFGVLILSKAGWIKIIELIVLAYFSSLYWLSCWLDFQIYNAKKVQTVGGSMHLVDDGREAFEESQEIFRQMSDLISPLLDEKERQGLSTERLSEITAMHRSLEEMRRAKMRLSDEKNEAILKVIRRAKAMKWLVFLLEVCVPSSLTFSALLSLLCAS